MINSQNIQQVIRAPAYLKHWIETCDVVHAEVEDMLLPECKKHWLGDAG